MGAIIGLLIIAAAVGIMVLMARDRGPGPASCRIEFTDGEVVTFEGRLAPRLQHGFMDVARVFKVTGSVTVCGNEDLLFSSTVSESNQQRFRNVWATRPGGTGKG